MICRVQQDEENEKARSSADARPPLSSLPATAWLARLERLCAALGASMIRRLVMGAPQTLQEEANARWLLHPLLVHAEVGSGREDVDRQEKALSGVDDATGAATPQIEAETTLPGVNPPRVGCSEGDGHAGAPGRACTFAQRLCRYPASRESRALATAMKRVVLEDRGGDQDTNHAVWAVAVAIVHHAGVAGEAAGVVRAELARAESHKDGTAGVPLGPSPALVRAWRSAQTARARLSSVALSSDARALLVRRAYFLLFLMPWASTSRGGSSTAVEGVRDAGVALALRTSELVLESLLSPAATAAREGGGGDGDGGGVADDKDDVEPDVGSREKGLGALLRIIEVQSERATSRARGLSLAVSLLDGTGSDRAAADVLRAVTDGLWARRPPRLKTSGSEGTDEHGAVREENADGEYVAGRFHFMLGVECCDSSSKAVLMGSATGFLRQSSLVLGRERAGDRGATGSSLARRSVLVHALVAVSMDYEWDDNGILQHSQLLPLILSLVDDADPSVAAAASAAVRAVYRCAVPEHRATKHWTCRGQSACVGGDAAGGGVTGEFGGSDGDTVETRGPRDRLGSNSAASSTPFQRAFFSAVRCKLQDMAATATSERQAKLDRTLPASSTTPLFANEPPPAGSIECYDGRGSAGSPLAGGEAAAGEKETPTASAALAAAQVLALAHACCRVECGRKELSGVGAIRALLGLVLLAESETRGWALRVCAATLPWVEPSLVDGEFR